MERKVGEIFEYNGEWYQCMHVPQKHSCKLCDLRGLCCDNNGVKIVTCVWRHREDNTSVIFKKLKKVGEPEIINGKKVQSIVTGYVGCAFCIFKKGGACLSGGTCKNRGTRIYVEIKQNKEDMEEKKLNLKEFDLEAAKAGKPVCTRDGRKARIICFDRNWEYPIVALIECENGEEMISACDKDGKARIYETQGTDLMMLPQKKEGWVRIYKSASNVYYLSSNIYKTEEEAKHSSDCCYVGASKISWEE